MGWKRSLKATSTSFSPIVDCQQVRSRLKELDNAGINQKAELEYTFYVEKRKELTDKCQQAEGNQNECWELMANVDMQKDDALQHTFSTVARHFRTIFRTLVTSWIN